MKRRLIDKLDALIETKGGFKQEVPRESSRRHSRGDSLKREPRNSSAASRSRSRERVEDRLIGSLARKEERLRILKLEQDLIARGKLRNDSKVSSTSKNAQRSCSASKRVSSKINDSLVSTSKASARVNNSMMNTSINSKLNTSNRMNNSLNGPRPMSRPRIANKVSRAITPVRETNRKPNASRQPSKSPVLKTMNLNPIVTVSTSKKRAAPRTDASGRLEKYNKLFSDNMKPTDRQVKATASRKQSSSVNRRVVTSKAVTTSKSKSPSPISSKPKAVKTGFGFREKSLEKRNISNKSSKLKAKDNKVLASLQIVKDGSKEQKIDNRNSFMVVKKTIKVGPKEQKELNSIIDFKNFSKKSGDTLVKKSLRYSTPGSAESEEDEDNANQYNNLTKTADFSGTQKLKTIHQISTSDNINQPTELDSEKETIPVNPKLEHQDSKRHSVTQSLSQSVAQESTHDFVHLECHSELDYFSGKGSQCSAEES